MIVSKKTYGAIAIAGIGGNLKVRQTLLPAPCARACRKAFQRIHSISPIKMLKATATMGLMLLMIWASQTIAFSADHRGLHAVNTGDLYNVLDFGAVGDGVTMNTDAFNRAVATCANQGGGTVFVPKGRFLSATIVLQSNVTLYLDSDATIVGSGDIEAYRSFQLRMDRSQPAYIRVRPNWFRSLVLLDHVKNVQITGRGTIDGNAVSDPQGEEGWRGPHAILVGHSQNVEISGIRVSRAGNYNIIGLDVDSLQLSDLTIMEGSDGIHIRKGSNILIRNCKIYSRDDAIAGGYWKDVTITDCLINTSCNGVRLIFPATNLEISHCQFSGPGLFGHRRSGGGSGLDNQSLTGILLQPGAWGYGPGNLDSVSIHNVRIRDFQTAFTFVLNEDNKSNYIRVEDLTATGIFRNACSVEAWPENSAFQNIELKNVFITYSAGEKTDTSPLQRPRTESRALPYWGLYARKVTQITMENVRLDYAGAEVRSALGFDQVGEARINGVYYRDVPGIKPVTYASSTVIKINALEAFK